MGSPQGSVGSCTIETDWAALIEKIAAGDQSALAALYDRTNRQVYGLILRILGDASAAEEVLLDVFMQIWRQAARYDTKRGVPQAWVLTIARSRAIDRLRSRRQEQQRRDPLDLLRLPAAAGNLEEAAVASERQKLVRAALADLPAEQREVIGLAYFVGLSQTEIAAELRQPLGTVKTRTRLGMMKLREALRPILEGAL